MRRLGQIVLAALLLGAVAFAPAAVDAAFKPISMRATVLGSGLGGSSLLVADERGDVHSVFVDKLLPAGTITQIRGSWDGSDRYAIWATAPDGRVKRLGRAKDVMVVGQLGFVDYALHRFQLGAHGQVVGFVSYPPKLEQQLRLLSRRPGQPAFRFSLAFAKSKLVLRTAPRPA